MAALKITAALESRCAQLESALRSTNALALQQPASPTSFNSDHHNRPKHPDDVTEDPEHVGSGKRDELRNDVYGVPIRDVNARRSWEQDPQSPELENSPPAYARLRQQKCQHHRQAERQQTAGVYEPFLWSAGSHASHLPIPMQSEPTLAQGSPNSPVSFREGGFY